MRWVSGTGRGQALGHWLNRTIALPQLRRLTADAIPWSPLQRPLGEAVVALVRRGPIARSDGQGRGGQRRGACWTARCRRVTSVSASMCRAGPRVVRARWYAGGGPGPVGVHEAGTNRALEVSLLHPDRR
jgi:hypothetical protein